MSLTGLLIVTQPAGALLTEVRTLLSAACKYVTRTLYVHIEHEFLTGPPSQDVRQVLPRSERLVCSLYSNSHCAGSVDIRILLDNLKENSLERRGIRNDFDVVLTNDICPVDDIKRLLSSRFVQSSDKVPIVPLNGVTKRSDDSNQSENLGEWKMYDNIVMGGTFDRLHAGHKILLSEAVLRCRKKLTIGVTDDNMIKKKVLAELAQPTDVRIDLLKKFLMDVDPTIQYFVTPISEPFGPSIVDPTLECIVVSEETTSGGRKVNEERKIRGMTELDMCVVSLVEDECHSQEEESKISSTSFRMRMLGTRLKTVQPKSKNGFAPYIIGLAGGIASGKSSICKRLKGLGAEVLNADQLAHHLYRKGNKTFQKIVDEFGSSVIGDDGEINRKVLGKIVFSDKEKLTQLNNIVWPDLKEELHSIVEQHKNNVTKVLVIEAAVLLEAGMDDLLDEVWVTFIPEDEAVRRIQERDNLSSEQAKNRISSQMSNTERLGKATVVFSSLWEPSYTQQQVEKAWSSLQEFLSSHNLREN